MVTVVILKDGGFQKVNILMKANDAGMRYHSILATEHLLKPCLFGSPADVFPATLSIQGGNDPNLILKVINWKLFFPFNVEVTF